MKIIVNERPYSFSQNSRKISNFHFWRNWIFNVGGQKINNLRFADNRAVIADSEKKLQILMTSLNEAYVAHGMKINTKNNKTEVMVIAKEPQPSLINQSNRSSMK